MKKFRAFTLVETLIMLIVIGVLAVLVIPAMLQNINDKILEKQRKTVATKIAEGFSQMRVAGALNEQYQNTQEFVNAMKKYFKIANVCESKDNLNDCFPEQITIGEEKQNTGTFLDNGDIISLKLSDGIGVMIQYNPEGDKIPEGYKGQDGKLGQIDETTGYANYGNLFYYSFDVNGSKSPNKIGKDIIGNLITSSQSSNGIDYGEMECSENGEDEDGNMLYYCQWCNDMECLKECDGCDENGHNCQMCMAVLAIDNQGRATKFCAGFGDTLTNDNIFACQESIYGDDGSELTCISYAGEDYEDCSYDNDNDQVYCDGCDRNLNGCSCEMYKNIGDGSLNCYCGDVTGKGCSCYYSEYGGSEEKSCTNCDENLNGCSCYFGERDDRWNWTRSCNNCNFNNTGCSDCMFQEFDDNNNQTLMCWGEDCDETGKGCQCNFDEYDGSRHTKTCLNCNIDKTTDKTGCYCLSGNSFGYEVEHYCDKDDEGCLTIKCSCRTVDEAKTCKCTTYDANSNEVKTCNACDHAGNCTNDCVLLP